MVDAPEQRLWTLSDNALVEMLTRVEDDEITADEAIAILLELATIKDDDE